MRHHLNHRLCMQGMPEMEICGQRVMLVIDSNSCVQWDKEAKEQRKKEVPSKRSHEGKSLERRTGRDPEWWSFTPGDLQNPTDRALTNTSNQPGFVQEVRPESCCIAQDFKNSFQSTSSKNFMQVWAKKLYQQNSTTGSIIPSSSSWGNPAAWKHLLSS